MKNLFRLLFTLVLLLGGLAQAQSTEYLRPTTYTGSSAEAAACVNGTYQSGSLSNAANAYDVENIATPTTAAGFGISGTGGPSNYSQYSGFGFGPWQTPTGSYTAAPNLKVYAYCSISGTGGGYCAITYTKDGTSYSTLMSSTTTASAQWYTIALNPGQDMSKVRVRFCGYGGGNLSSPGSATWNIYDIRTEGMLAAAAGPKFQLTTTD